MKPKLFIVTGNLMKFRELSAKLGEFFECEQKTLDEPEIQGKPQEIIKHKLKLAYQKLKHPVLVDDTSLHIEELNGFPGPYIKDFWQCFTPQEMGTKFAGSRMKVINHIGLSRGENDIILAEGSVEGKIIAPKDNNHEGREFDLFFQVDGTDKVMMEFPTEEKNKFSHRGKALDNLIEILKKENQ
jgi:inosine triphosphate pyrophosphatase